MATVLPPQQQDQTYTFSSHPRAVQQKRKYREKFGREDEQAQQKIGNLMYDRRVIRGNTYSHHLIPTTAQPDPLELQRQQEIRRRALAKKRARDQLKPRTPDAVEGRQHQDVQTELYLEELSDRIEEADVEAQTDDFLDRPPSPLFVPAKSGADMETQIYPGELFDFDLEVKPILEVLVGKTLEQSNLEVMEEEELASLRCQQRKFMEMRNAEKVEEQRLEEQDRRRNEEKGRRKDQQLQIIRQEKETADKVAARAFAHSYLSDLVPQVFGTLAEHGYFYDPVERDIEQGFLPWLMDSVDEELADLATSRLTLDGLLREVVTERHLEYHKLLETLKNALLASEASKALGGLSDEAMEEAALAQEVDHDNEGKDENEELKEAEDIDTEKPEAEEEVVGEDHAEEDS